MNREKALEVIENFVQVNKLTEYLRARFYNTGSSKDRYLRGKLYTEMCDDLGMVKNPKFHAAAAKAAQLLGYKPVKVNGISYFKFMSRK